MRSIVLLAFFLTTLAATPSPAPSPPPAMASTVELARSRITSMLQTGHADASWFSSDFLAQVSIEQVNAVLATLLKTLGPFQSLEYTPEKFVAHFAKGTNDVLIHLDADNKIDGLLFRPPAVSLDDALRSLRQRAGSLSYLIVEEGRAEVAALNPSEPLAVGSAFKLAVLNALRDEIHRGTRHWSDVVPLRAQWKSLPSGVLQGWPDGTPLTLATYAAEMISISDNTAADALIHLVGSGALQRYAFGNDPFLTTREVFIMISTEATSLREQYDAARSSRDRAAILRRTDALPLPALTRLNSTPDLAVEWHYSVRALCGLMERVENLPLMSINPGVAEPSHFAHVAYKGGSGPGAINLTTMVTTRRGTRICFAATLNDPAHALDETSFETAYSSALNALAER